MPASFVHLHLHSEFSLIDSTIRVPAKLDRKLLDPETAPVPNLISEAVRHRLPALAVTDEANVFALVRFYRACELAGIKPIIGADLRVTIDERQHGRATLLCLDRRGFTRLSQLLTRSYQNRSGSGEVVIERSWLEDDCQGLAMLLGPESGLGMAATSGRDELAAQELHAWQRAFSDRLYLEVLRTGREREAPWLDAARTLGGEHGLPLVASNDVRFLRREDFDAHEARVAINRGWLLSDPKRPRPYSESQYLKSPAEMAELFADLPEAIDNGIDLARRANLEISFGQAFLPAFPVPRDGLSEPGYLRERALEGLAQRLASRGAAPEHDAQSYAARLDLELGVIEGMGFPGYFLIVADFIDYARRQDIPVGPGRGSGAGSLVAYAIGITDIDPLRFDLLFERFLNPERVSLPDFDIDFCMDRRDEVIDYVAKRYGRDRVSQIITFGTMAAKAVLRDTGRVLGMSYGHVDRIAKMIPMGMPDITLDDALGRSEKSQQEPQRVAPELRDAYVADDEVRQLVDLAIKLEGLTRNAGKHAGGVVIAPTALTDFTPLYSEDPASAPVTHYDKDDLEAVGLVKFDFLGLRTLTIIDIASKAINRRRAVEDKPRLDVALLPLDDRLTYQLLQRHSTTAVFQLESASIKNMVRRLRPDRFDDLVALVALHRPGPMNSGMDKDYIARKHGQAQVRYAHPSLMTALKPTYGVFIYQEQVMQIAQELAGYSLGGADLLRRAMSKKDAVTMAKERSKFEDGASARGVDARIASGIFDQIQEFAEYGFNKSHSAAYALLAYQTAWLKAHYPAEFMAAVLTADMDNTERLVHALADARAIGLAVDPPQVNDCSFVFDATEPARIRYGLGAVKGVGRAAVEALIAARDADGPFLSLADLCCRVDSSRLNKRALEALVMSGAADALDPARNRRQLFETLGDAMQLAERVQRDRDAGQSSLFGEVSAGASPATLPKRRAAIEDYSRAQKLKGERDSLGHYLSGHPIDDYKPWLAQLVTAPLAELEAHFKPQPITRPYQRPEQAVMLGGMLGEMRRFGDDRLTVWLDDDSARAEVTFYQDTMEAAAPLLLRDAIVLIEGAMGQNAKGNFRLVGHRVTLIDEALGRYARLLEIEIDGSDGGPPVDALMQTLAPCAGGHTPVRIVWQDQSAQAAIELDERTRLTVKRELLTALEALPGVRAAKLLLSRPVVELPRRKNRREAPG